MRKRLTILGVLLAISANGTFGAVTEFGNPGCNEWVSANNSGNKVWLLGYLSGLNLAFAKANNDPLDKVQSVEDTFVWMDNYCRNNPKKTIGEAAQVFYGELKMKGKQ